ncbi:MAG: hypothetical protein M3417_03270, partial [Actinomycetota bacterium]|nr:hypothetical protein [Actinomycetota bacterium]
PAVGAAVVWGARSTNPPFRVGPSGGPGAARSELRQQAQLPAPAIRPSVRAGDVRTPARRNEACRHRVGQPAATGRVELAQQLDRVNERARGGTPSKRSAAISAGT